MDWFLYDNGLRHERVNNRFKHYLSTTPKYIPIYNSTYPSGIYLFKFNNGNRKRVKFFKVNNKDFERISQLRRAFLYLFWTSKYQLIFKGQFVK